MIKKEKIINVLEYILNLCIILEMNSVYSQIYGLHKIIRACMVIVACFSLLILLLLRRNKLTKKNAIVILIDYLISIIMYFNTNSVTGKGVILLVFDFFLPLMYLYLDKLSKKEIINFLKKMVNVIVVLCCISLVFYFLSTIIKVLKPTNTIKILWAKPYSEIDSFFYIHFNTQVIYWVTNSPLMRNTGIYTEGPMYALILVIGLMLNCLIINEKNKYNYIKSLIISITAITTFSFTGILCTGIILLIYVFDLYQRLNKRKKYVMIIVSFTIAIILIPLIISFIEKKMITTSASHRKMDFINGIEIFEDSPFIGKGINHKKPDELNPEEGYGYSNAIIPVITDGGIVLLLFYIIPSIKVLIFSIKNRYKKYILFEITFFILLITSQFQYRMLMILMILLQCNIPRIEKEKT